jgi:putative endonuclease
MATWWHYLPWCSDPRVRRARQAARARRASGVRAERAALWYLRCSGLRLVARNYRTRSGEIDLVMRDGTTLVFVEVRLRNRVEFGDGAASVGLAKQRRLIRTAEQFVARHALQRMQCRFDVVSVRKPHYRLHLKWIRNAFTA